MKKHFLMLSAASIAMAFVCTCCTKEVIYYDRAYLTTYEPIRIYYETNNPTAGYPIGVRIRLEAGNIIAEGMTTYWNDYAHACGVPYNDYSCKSAATIADYGKAKGLFAIKSIPEASEFKMKVPVLENEGYVVEMHGTAMYGYFGLEDPGKIYIRICVLEQTSSGDYVVDYSVPFVDE